MPKTRAQGYRMGCRSISPSKAIKNHCRKQTHPKAPVAEIPREQRVVKRTRCFGPVSPKKKKRRTVKIRPIPAKNSKGKRNGGRFPPLAKRMGSRTGEKAKSKPTNKATEDAIVFLLLKDSIRELLSLFFSLYHIFAEKARRKSIKSVEFSVKRRNLTRYQIPCVLFLFLFEGNFSLGAGENPLQISPVAHPN